MNTSKTPRRLMRPAALLAALSALGLTFSLMVGPALAVPTYATVTGYEPFSSEANHPEFWESEGVECTKDESAEDTESYELPALLDGQVYVQVIVKAASQNVDPYTNTIFAEPPVAGETVWADTNGDGLFNPGGRGGDKQISHIIVCTGEAQESEEASVEESTEASVEESTEASVEESTEASVEESTEASVEESTEASVEESTEASVEGSVLGGTGTPAPSTPDTAMGSDNGPSPLPTIFFGAILVASLAGLAWVNVNAVRNRS